MNSSGPKSVVITGASSGIGRASVARMVKRGWTVFAGVRKEKDGAQLEAAFGAQVTPILMDVTDHESIVRAAEQVKHETTALDGLVNVAGVGIVRPIEYATLEEIRHTFEINTFGQIAVTQAFLPLLRQAQGRIVNITTVGVHIPLPFGALLNASKSAFSTFSDSLRVELHPFGVRVIAIEPGAIRTPAVEKTLGGIDEMIRALPPEAQKRYGDLIRTFTERGYAREENGSPPDVVAQAVESALTVRRPRIRYVVGKHARFLTTLPKLLPERALDQVMLRVAGMPTKFGARELGRARSRKQAA